MAVQPEPDAEECALEIREFFRFFWMDWLASPARQRELEEASGLPRSAQVILQRLHTDGPMTTPTLANALMLDRSTISRQLRPLKELGLVVAETDGTGRRSKLSLTPKGRALAARIDGMVMTGYTDAVTRLPLGRQRALAALLAELRDAMVASVIDGTRR
jgi:DNA-binding MarR family transcriptional regulator